MTLELDATLGERLAREAERRGLDLDDFVRPALEALVGGPDARLAGFVGILPDEDAAEMMAIIDGEFNRIDPNEWQ